MIHAKPQQEKVAFCVALNRFWCGQNNQRSHLPLTSIFAHLDDSIIGSRRWLHFHIFIFQRRIFLLKFFVQQVGVVWFGCRLLAGYAIVCFAIAPAPTKDVRAKSVANYCDVYVTRF